jgi:hypothetical protein
MRATNHKGHQGHKGPSEKLGVLCVLRGERF